MAAKIDDTILEVTVEITAVNQGSIIIERRQEPYFRVGAIRVLKTET